MNIETVLSPSLFKHVEMLSSKVVIVIDILRATSTITTILDQGASSVIAVSDATEAFAYLSEGYLVGGERNGETIPGFNFGNSPIQYIDEDILDKTIVLTTTNGTKCIEMSKNASEVIMGSFLNLSAVVNHSKKTEKDIVLFCAGWKDKVNLEDSLFAGAFIAQFPNVQLDDSSLLCLDAYEASKSNLFESLKSSNHFNRLKSKGVLRDIEYCCQVDTINSVPILQHGKIINKSDT